VLALAVLAVLIFMATEVLPGDATGALAGPSATEQQRAELRHQLGLDKPAAVRFGDWVAGAVTGDLGKSMAGRRPITDVLAERLPNSLLLTVSALLLATPLAIGLGLAAGLRAGRGTDRVVSASMLVVAGLPEFLTVVALTGVFATWLGLVPQVSLAPLGGRPWDAPQVLVLPVLSLMLIGLAATTRLVRATAAEVASAPYVEAARLAGVSGLRLALRHVLPNSLGPAVQVVAVMFGGLTGGAVVVETIFSYPGVGFELQQAVANRDVPMVQGLALALSAVSLAVLLVGDLVAAALDPRRRGLR
jgi:peptide/nickel transport system permease protein